MKKQPAMEYKKAFLKANKCTVHSFESAYIQFMEKNMMNPSEKALRSFAKHWNIIIYEGLGDSGREAALSVHITAMKVLADTELEAKSQIMKLMQEL